MKTNILQLKITLEGIKPQIWRRIEVKDDITFYELHLVIQIAMGWWNEHLFEFKVGDYTIGYTGDGMAPEGTLDSKDVRLSRIVDTEKMTFGYLYDFGDSWYHEIEVEKIKPAEKNKTYPACTGGERNCPPENVMGPPGYMNFVTIMSDKNHPEYNQMRDWYGDDYDPEEFNFKETNDELQFIIKTKKWNPN